MQVKIHHKLSTITMMLGEGREGITYYDGKYAIKILNPFASKLTLKEEDIDRMKSIKVTALDHPIACAYSLDNMYLGPVSNYIHENGYQNFRTVSSSSFIDIIKQIKEDANVYASYHYLIGDLQLRDSLFDQKGHLHLVDSGSYQYCKNDSVSILENENQKEINHYLLHEVLDSMMNSEGISLKRRKHIIKEMEEESNVEKILEGNVRSYPYVFQYVKAIRRK